MPRVTRRRLRKTNPKRRAYRQERRAQQTGANTDRIIKACVALIKSVRHVGDITLDDVSRESGLTVRTILRRFGSRDGVLDAAFGHLETEFRSARRPSPPGDTAAAIVSLVDQYEEIGDLNIRGLEEEDQLALLHNKLELGRRYHRDWLRATFSPQLSGLAPGEQERRITALYAATDVYLWKLLRRDLKLDREQTEETFSRLVRGVLMQSGLRTPNREGKDASRTD